MLRVIALANGLDVMPAIAIVTAEEEVVLEEELTAVEKDYAVKEGCVWRTINGRKVCITPRGTDEERAARAKATYKPATKEVQDQGDLAADQVARWLNASTTGNNDPMDIVTTVAGQRHGVEVKAFVHNTHDKVTMHPGSVRRKDAWARANRATTHTVVVDYRSATRKVYYKRGHGSFRLGGMERVADGAHLRALMRKK